MACRTNVIVQIASKHGMSLVDLSLAWCQQRHVTTCSIVGATSISQLKQNLAAFEVQLTPECVADVEAVYKKYTDPARIE